MNIELTYNGKQRYKDILSRANDYKKININKSTFIKGDNFAVMSSLINGNMEGKIDFVYIDPPFNTKQNFNISDTRISTISRSGIVNAYHDNMPFEEYLEFMRERIILIHKLLSKQGSLYLHIDNKVGHYIKIILDEIFGADNFKNDITRKKSNPKNFNRKAYGNQKDMILFYVKDKNNNIWNDIKEEKSKDKLLKSFPKIDTDGRRYTTVPVHAPGETKNGKTGGMWKNMKPPQGRHWRADPSELDELDKQGLIEWSSTGNPRIKKYADEHKGDKIQDIWDYIDPAYPVYPTEKNSDMLEMLIKQSSNENSVVMDCFSGSGNILKIAYNLGRMFIGIDNSDFSEKIIMEKIKDTDYDFMDYNDNLVCKSKNMNITSQLNMIY